MDRHTRHQLKQDEFRDTLENLEVYLKEHYKEILNVTIIVVAVIAIVGSLKYYTDRQAAPSQRGPGRGATNVSRLCGPSSARHHGSRRGFVPHRPAEIPEKPWSNLTRLWTNTK